MTSGKRFAPRVAYGSREGQRDFGQTELSEIWLPGSMAALLGDSCGRIAQGHLDIQAFGTSVKNRKFSSTRAPVVLVVLVVLVLGVETVNGYPLNCTISWIAVHVSVFNETRCG